MYQVDTVWTMAFSENSIEELGCLTSADIAQIDEPVALIESFSQPFPLRERGKPVTDGEMDAYG